MLSVGGLGGDKIESYRFHVSLAPQVLWGKVLLEISVQPSTYRFWAFKPVYTNALASQWHWQWITVGNIGQQLAIMCNNWQQWTAMDNNLRCYMHLWCHIFNHLERDPPPICNGWPQMVKSWEKMVMEEWYRHVTKLPSSMGVFLVICLFRINKNRHLTKLLLELTNRLLVECP